ncbi:Mitochondrial fission factor [Nymphon striatum]|nr:Mitochondrial fission factor [Nymphon striatum]
MSSESSPAHFISEFPPYDPLYTADISNRMRVPDRIHVIGNTKQNQESVTTNHAVGMNVPERILVTGNEEHVAGPVAPRELTLESSILPSKMDTVELDTPPRTLTLSTHAYPSADHEEGVALVKNALKRLYDEYGNKIEWNGDKKNKDDVMALDTSASEVNGIKPYTDVEDELRNLHNQVRGLKTRMKALEEDNIQMQQREVLAYSAAFMYIVLKGLFWIHKHW